MDEEDKLLKRHECQTQETGFALQGPGTTEGLKQGDQKADTSNSELCGVSLKVGKSISWLSANTGVDEYKKWPDHQQREEEICLHDIKRV